MKLLDIVVKESIIPQLKATTRDTAISEMIDTLVTAGAVKEDQRDEFVKAVIRRENKGSTIK